MSQVQPRWDDPALLERDLLRGFVERLTALLGEGWSVHPRSEARGMPDARPDAVWQVVAPDASSTTFVVEAKTSGMSPRNGYAIASQLSRVRDAVGDDRAVSLVVTPYLSPRSREVFDELGVSYMDSTGNVSLRSREPAILIRTEGAQKDPTPRPESRRGMSGPRAARLVRELVDRHPPRRGNELAVAAELSESYVSRLLELFSDEALLRRHQRVVTEVDWAGLLRARASSYELMRANHVVPAIARSGREATLDRLRDRQVTLAELPEPILATGTFAANGFAPLVAGGALLLYIPTTPSAVTKVCKTLGLLRVEENGDADVLLLQPMTHGVFDRPHPDLIDGVRIPALSQVVLDCLSGPGRLPAAGEELINWMRDHEGRWRAPSPLVSDS